MYKFWNKLKNKINHGFALTYNTLKKINANEFEIYSTEIFLGKYLGNGGKAEKNEELVKKIPLSSTNQKTAF